MGAGERLLALLRVLLGRVLPTFVHGESQEGPAVRVDAAGRVDRMGVIVLPHVTALEDLAAEDVDQLLLEALAKGLRVRLAREANFEVVLEVVGHLAALVARRNRLVVRLRSNVPVRTHRGDEARQLHVFDAVGSEDLHARVAASGSHVGPALLALGDALLLHDLGDRARDGLSARLIEVLVEELPEFLDEAREGGFDLLAVLVPQDDAGGCGC